MTTMLVRRPHPGAALFDGAAREEAVARGPYDGYPPRLYTNRHGCCVVGALIRAAFGDMTEPVPAFRDAAEAIECGLGRALTATERRQLGKLIARNDRGHYARRANLLRDLLGEEEALG